MHNSLKEYYQHAELELAEPLSRFHQYRVRLSGNKWLRIRDTVRTVDDLRRWVIALQPLDCYATVNPFLNPSGVSYAEFNGRKAGFNWSNNLLLGDGVLIFDVDFHERGFNDCKNDALSIRDYLKERGYCVDEVTFTGKGFHLKCFHHDLHLPRCYSSRNMNAIFKQYRELRGPFLEELERMGIQCDREITLDCRRIARVIGTVNSKNSCVCTKVRDLGRFEESEAVKLNLEGGAPTSPNGAMTGFFPTDKEAVDPHWRKGELTRRKLSKPDQINSANSDLGPSPTLYLGSPVISTCDRQIVMLRFKSDMNLTELTKTLSRFAAQEQLAPFLIFKSTKDPDGLWGISPTAVQTAGMKRLLHRFPRDNSCYVKFHRRIVPLPLEYVAQSSGVVDSEIPVSKAHMRYFSHYGLIKYEPRVSCGSENLLPLPIGEMK